MCAVRTTATPIESSPRNSSGKATGRRGRSTRVTIYGGGRAAVQRGYSASRRNRRSSRDAPERAIAPRLRQRRAGSPRAESARRHPRRARFSRSRRLGLELEFLARRGDERLLVGRGDCRSHSGHDRLLGPLVEPLPAALDRRQELVQVDLERREDRVRPILHLQPRLAGLAAGVVDDVLGLALGDLDELRLRRLANGLLARLAQQPVGLALRLGEHLLPFLDDPAGLLDLLRDRRAHLVEDVVDLLSVDPDLVGQGNGIRVVHEVVELVDENEYVHWLQSTLGG